MNPATWGRRALILVPVFLLVAVAWVYFAGRDEVAEVVEPPLPAIELSERDHVEAVRLYFGASDRVGLQMESRTLVASGTLEERLRACIHELARGSLEDGLRVVPPKTRLRRAFLDPWGAAYLDFSRELLGETIAGDGDEWLAVAAIVRTVCDNYPEVREIRFLIEGQMVVSLGGYVDLEEPLRAEDFPLHDGTPS